MQKLAHFEKYVIIVLASYELTEMRVQQLNFGMSRNNLVRNF